MPRSSTSTVKLVEEAAPRPSDFAKARAEWMCARAGLARLEAYPDPADYVRDADPVNVTLNAIDAAEQKLLLASASSLNEIRDRAEIVLQMFAAADVAGEPADNRHRLMLSALISEILTVVP